ncbi:acyl carrier protein [Parachlamydia sp. AcF125]|uniref:acyl carrier protein n=1 Tax=Parachlamydia sp. AcF125 TaxID=2795736 RepID=UPI001BC972CF|nr:acyl carrier protein [Parachlamydia sp. AcF125]MBS4169186.1 Acyl carrier protein [Parachlamydia sp. AcF125]
MTIEQEVIDIVVEQLGVDQGEVTLDKSFVEDLNADSLDLTELIMTFEERFKQYDCEISEEQAEKLKTVGDAVAFIQNCAEQKKG